MSTTPTDGAVNRTVAGFDLQDSADRSYLAVMTVMLAVSAVLYVFEPGPARYRGLAFIVTGLSITAASAAMAIREWKR